MEDWPPLLLGSEVRKDFNIEKPGRVGAVVGSPHLAPALFHFGKGAEFQARVVHHTDAFGWPDARRQRSAHPQCSFVEVRQKLRTDYATHGEVDGDEKAKQRNAHRDVAVFNGPFHGMAITDFQEL